MFWTQPRPRQDIGYCKPPTLPGAPGAPRGFGAALFYQFEMMESAPGFRRKFTYLSCADVGCWVQNNYPRTLQHYTCHLQKSKLVRPFSSSFLLHLGSLGTLGDTKLLHLKQHDMPKLTNRYPPSLAASRFFVFFSSRSLP